MKEKCAHCGNMVIGQFSPSDTRKWLTTLAKKGGMKAVLTAAGSVVPGFGNISGFLAGTAIDIIYGKDINKLVDKIADEFDDKKIYVFECPNCGHTWSRKETSEITKVYRLGRVDVFYKLRKIIANHLGLDENEISMTDRLIEDLGADSLDAVEIIMEIEKNFGLDIPDSDARRVRTVEDIIRYLQERSGLDDEDDDNDWEDEEEDEDSEEEDDDENEISLYIDGKMAENAGNLQAALTYYIKSGDIGADDVIRLQKLISNNPTSPQSLFPTRLLSSLEAEYLDEIKACLVDGGEISNGERRLLEKLRVKLGISESRATEIESSLLRPQLTEAEQEYINEYQACKMEDGTITPGERRLLNKLRLTLGISEERANELEQLG